MQNSILVGARLCVECIGLEINLEQEARYSCLRIFSRILPLLGECNVVVQVLSPGGRIPELAVAGATDKSLGCLNEALGIGRLLMCVVESRRRRARE